MKRTFTILLALCFTFSLSYQSYASICFAHSTGDWTNPNIWDCYDDDGINQPDAIPAPGDIIIIEGPNIVYYYETIDLSTVFDNEATVLVINGELLNYTLALNCEEDRCNIDIIMDSGSEIFVETEDGLSSEGPNNGDKEVIIGGLVVLNIFPFGPGILPEDLALPVKITSFKGEALKNENLISWETENEENTSIFLVERSLNGVDGFREISRLNANGDSNTLQFYKIEDISPSSSSYYRLKTIYFDGSYEYSNIIVIERNTEIFNLDVYPVPANEEVNVLYNSKENGIATVSISNCLGTVIKNDEVILQNGLNRLYYNFSNLNPGMYIISINTGAEIISKTFLVKH